MTNRHKRLTTNPPRTPRRLRAASLAVPCWAALLGLSACGEDNTQQTAAPPPPTVERAWEPPARVEVRLAEGVEFPQDRTPTEPGLGQSIADFAAAMAGGDAEAMAALLDAPDAAMLSSMVESGAWREATSSIELVRVVAVQPGEGAFNVGMAVQESEGAYLVAWEARSVGDRWRFAGLPVDAVTAARASELDGVSLAVRGVPTPGAVIDDKPAPAPRPEEDAQRAPRPASGPRQLGG